MRNDICHPCFDQWRTAVDGAESEDSEDILGRHVRYGRDSDEEDAAQARKTSNEWPFGLILVGE